MYQFYHSLIRQTLRKFIILNVKWFPIGFHYFLNSEIFKLTIKNSKNKAQMNINN